MGTKITMSHCVRNVLKQIKRRLCFMKKNNNVTNKTIIDLKDIVQDCNINFLIGAGLSSPYLALLGQVEKLLTRLPDKKEDRDIKKIIRASLYKKFFDDVIVKNLNILSWSEESNTKELNSVLEQYQNFIKNINTILLNRKSTILSKQVNLFTTNFDIFLEKALETANVEYNDGFSGRFNPIFNLSNFKKIHF